jgi:hypothetical protein
VETPHSEGVLKSDTLKSRKKKVVVNENPSIIRDDSLVSFEIEDDLDVKSYSQGVNGEGATVSS